MSTALRVGLRERGVLAITVALFLVWPGAVRAQEPETREEALRRQREEKSRNLTPPEPSRLESTLLDLEGRRVLERLLNPPEGFYPKIGNVTAGSGIALGPGYRKAGLLDGRADFTVFGAASFKRYWMLETRLALPRLANNRVAVDVHAQRYEFPEEDFFGLGAESLRGNHTTFGLANTVVGGAAAVRPVPWFAIGGGLDYLTPHISTSGDDQTIRTRFDDARAPGLDAQPDYIRYQTFAELNYRGPRGNPRRGGRYALSFERFEDTDLDSYSFRRVEADLQQYIPIVKDRRVLALHALVSTSDADDGHAVPFYLQRTLGGPDDLRGFRRFRFRDQHALLLQAEYRWEIFTAVDGAIFYDAGKVASRLEDLDLTDLESDYGIGFRFGTRNGVFLRIEGAFGSSGGKHFIFRFGHVF